MKKVGFVSSSARIGDIPFLRNTFLCFQGRLSPPLGSNVVRLLAPGSGFACSSGPCLFLTRFGEMLPLLDPKDPYFWWSVTSVKAGQAIHFEGHKIAFSKALREAPHPNSRAESNLPFFFRNLAVGPDAGSFRPFGVPSLRLLLLTSWEPVPLRILPPLLNTMAFYVLVSEGGSPYTF